MEVTSEISDFSDEVYEPREVPHQRIFLEVFTIAGLLSVAANVVISFVILKYKKMRQDPTNVIFLHVNILQALCLIATLLTIRVAMDLMGKTIVPSYDFCVSYQMETSTMLVLEWFFFLLVCDWFLKHYFKDAHVKFRRMYKFFVAALYVFIIVTCYFTFECAWSNSAIYFVYAILFGLIDLLAIFIIIINVVHAIKKRKTVINNRRGSFGLALANISILVWAPVLIFFTVDFSDFERKNRVPLYILLVIGFSSPIFNIIYLYFYDDLYNVFLKRVFTCKCNQNENEELESHSVMYNDPNCVQIPDQ